MPENSAIGGVAGLAHEEGQRRNLPQFGLTYFALWTTWTT